MFLYVFKQKTAYDMRIIDWSSDVCSSDLAAKSGREYMRRDHGHQRIGPGNACPCSNEREHIRIAVDDTLPTASKKRPAAPEHYWCRKRKLDPVKHAMRQDVTESHP